MVDYTKPIQTTDGVVASVVQTFDTNGDYKWAISYKDDDGDTIVDMFDAEGDSLNGVINIENVPGSSEESEGDGKFVLPSILQIGIYHSKKGSGTVLKVRNHPTKRMLVRFPGGNQDGVWVFDKNVTRA